MLKIEQGKTNVIEITVDGKFQSTDFDQLTETLDKLTKKYDSIKIFIHSTNFEGWNDLTAMQKHFCVVQSYHSKVEKVAVIIGPWWQNVMVGFANILIHPKVKVFEESEIDDARKWLQ